MSKGKLIVIEGVDGSGKSTQVSLVCEALKAKGKKVKQISFPTYTKSSALIEMYLAGEFGNSPDDVNAYAASTFYAVDRYASYMSDWKKDYDEGALVITARYTTSNAIHQSVKLEGEEREKYLLWLEDYEYGLMGLPSPDEVIFLDMPIEKGQELLSKRYGNVESKKDVHERDVSYQKKCYDTAVDISGRLGWHRIDCTDGGRIKAIDEITKEILDVIEY